MNRSLLLALILCACASPGAGPAASKRIAPRPWEHERSDIPADPRIRFGALENGMRFAWMRNSEPKFRSYLRLHVDVGSLAEKEDERGMAHFLEHMAFNGTRHWPDTSLIEWFQRHGMAFGADTNAHTGFSETVYEIDLPTSDADSLAEGLAVLRDFADGILLEAKQVDGEKGVIDAEERERDSPSYRILERSWKIELAGSRIPERIPIGVKSVRDRFTPDSVRTFYRRWYRPENMTLLLVGDLGDLDPSDRIRKAFADFAAPTSPLEREPAVGAPTFAHRTYAILEKDASEEMIGLGQAKPYEDHGDDVAHAKTDLPLRFARSMLDLRLHELSKREGAPFLSAETNPERADGLRVEDGEALSIRCTGEKWSEALAACELELRRALELGFDDSELAEIRADALRGLDEAVERERTRSSASCVSELLEAAEERHVATSAETDRSIYKPMIEALDAKACSAAYTKAWKEGATILGATGNLDLGADAEKRLEEALRASRKVPVEAREKAEKKPFAYSSDPARAGAIAKRAHVDEFDLDEVVFENGVRLHVKKTDFKEKQVYASAQIGEGELSLDVKQRVLRFAAAAALTGGGLGAHDADELRRLTAGKTVGVGFEVGDQSFELGGPTTREDLLLECELMRAYLVDPGWREEGLRQFEKQVPVLFDSLEHQPGGPITLSFLPELYSGDERTKFPERAQFEGVTTAAEKEWLGASLGDAPIDLALVGDLDVEAAVTAAARTFGLLPKRRAADRHEYRRGPVELVPGLRRTYEIDTEVPKSLILISYPATDGRDSTTRRRLSFLANVLSDRLRVEVREKLGASYSPGAGVAIGEVRPNDGWIAVQAMAEPDKAEELAETCVKVADLMAEQGLTQEEVERQRKPAQAEIRDRLRTNEYWLEVLSRLHWNEKAFDDARTFPTYVDTIQAADLDPLAKAYLGKARASVAIVAPKKKG
jgi:zinc protease